MNKAYDSSKADEAPKQFEYYAEFLFFHNLSIASRLLVVTDREVISKVFLESHPSFYRERDLFLSYACCLSYWVPNAQLLADIAPHSLIAFYFRLITGPSDKLLFSAGLIVRKQFGKSTAETSRVKLPTKCALSSLRSTLARLSTDRSLLVFVGRWNTRKRAPSSFAFF